MADPTLSDTSQTSSPQAAPPDIAAGSQGTKGRNGRGWQTVVEWVVIIAATVLVTLLVKTFLIQAFYIPSGSMEPTLKPGDRVLVAKTLYSIHRGDIIVFKKPPSDHAPGVSDLIKRVIGLPGDRISAHGGDVYVNGHQLNESWLPKVDRNVTSTFGPDKIPKGEYFVMGDNRTNSDDSRFIGDIPAKLIVGKMFIKIWPFTSVTLY